MLRAFIKKKNGHFQSQTQKCGDIVFHAFDPVVVRIRLDSNNIQHEKFVLQLVSPFIEGFSVPPLCISEAKESIAEGKKRKSPEPKKRRNKKSKS